MREPEPEPVDPPEESTLEHLNIQVTAWESCVRSLEIGNDVSDEYTHDIFKRYCLHGTLNGYMSQGLPVPEALQARIDEADRRFMAATFALDRHFWNGPEEYDPVVFWYYYRWPAR